MSESFDTYDLPRDWENTPEHQAQYEAKQVRLQASVRETHDRTVANFGTQVAMAVRDGKLQPNLANVAIFNFIVETLPTREATLLSEIERKRAVLSGVLKMINLSIDEIRIYALRILAAE